MDEDDYEPSRRRGRYKEYLCDPNLKIPESTRRYLLYKSQRDKSFLVEVRLNKFCSIICLKILFEKIFDKIEKELDQIKNFV